VAGPDELVTCEIHVPGATAAAAAARAARGWLTLWSDYVRATVPTPVTFVVETIEANDVDTPTVSTENGKLRIHINLPTTTRRMPASLLRRHLLDQMLLGLEQAADMGAEPPVTAIKSRAAVQSHSPNPIASELQILQPQDVLIMVRVDSGDDDRSQAIEEQLIDTLADFHGSEIADTSHIGNMRCWIVSI
jgi:hypothetical protein